MQEPLIKIRNLSKAFGEKVVLDGLDLDAHKGESLVIIGGSGTGKSVLIKNILGLINPDSGSIKIDGKEVIGESSNEQQERMKKTGMVFQGSALFDSLPIWENVAFGLINNQDKSREEARDLALQMLAKVGLDHAVGDLYPAEISGGMQRRVALARAVVSRPEIIFFDEPTAGLDPIFCGVINELIKKCVKELGATAVTITHDMNSARGISDRIAMIYGGKIIWQGAPDTIERTNDPYVQQFIHGRSEGPITIENSASGRAA